MIGRARVTCVAMLLFIAAGMPVSSEAREFRLGLISKKPVQKKISGYDPLAGYVAERLKPFGVTGGKVVVAADLDAMLLRIRNNEVDVLLESPFSAVKIADKTGMEPRLLVWKEGVREYRSVFFVRKESPIRTLRDLKGKVLVLQDPGSTSGYLVPIVELRRHGLAPVPSKDGASPAAVQYRMVEHEKNQVFWVLQKKAAAGAFGTDDWNDLGEPQKRELRVIHTSKPVLRYLALFHPGLPPEMSSAIIAAMTQMHRDPEGFKALRGASDTTKIEPLSDADLKSLDAIRRLMQEL